MARKPIRTTIEENLLNKLKEEAFVRGLDMNDILEILLRKFFDGEVGIDSIVSEKVSFYGEGNEILDKIKRSVLRINFELFERYDLPVSREIVDMINLFADVVVKTHEISSVQKKIDSINRKMEAGLNVVDDIEGMAREVRERNKNSLNDAIILVNHEKDNTTIIR